MNIQVEANGSKVITTKGDANSGSIPLIDTNITEAMYIGKVVLQFPLAGYVTETPYNEYIALVIFGALIGELYFERKASAKAKRQQSSVPEAKPEIEDPALNRSDLTSEPSPKDIRLL